MAFTGALAAGRVVAECFAAGAVVGSDAEGFVSVAPWAAAGMDLPKTSSPLSVSQVVTGLKPFGRGGSATIPADEYSHPVPLRKNVTSDDNREPE